MAVRDESLCLILKILSILSACIPVLLQDEDAESYHIGASLHRARARCSWRRVMKAELCKHTKADRFLFVFLLPPALRKKILSCVGVFSHARRLPG
jgi:hypothetical protein